MPSTKAVKFDHSPTAQAVGLLESFRATDDHAAWVRFAQELRGQKPWRGTRRPR